MVRESQGTLALGAPKDSKEKEGSVEQRDKKEMQQTLTQDNWPTGNSVYGGQDRIQTAGK